MARFPLIDPKTASGRPKQLLDGVQAALGLVPNLTRALANAPAALQGYLSFSGALGTGLLPAGVREQIALTVAQANSCDYCLSAHTAIGKMVGLSANDATLARQAEAGDAKTTAALRFAHDIVLRRGELGQADLDAVRQAGWSDAEIIEIIAHAALNIFTNYFNHIADTDIDFPRVTAAQSVA